MATKTITIDMDAYKRLKAVKDNNESFSQTIKRVIKEPMDLKAFKKRLEKNIFSPEAVKAIEEHIRQRGKTSKRTR
ncbi:MAG: hypothetical protein A2Y12_00675 [Planctomycetes bacterium GWF2_42_9]|nr:MAG: hypothetical protein A2Y12_00675 [Planctomycetes bacterium GWF2_42_9]HAL44721.1 hypothetical protein [Phycisphaerales bacterium]